MKVKITIKGKDEQAAAMAEALSDFMNTEFKDRAKYPEKTKYEVNVVRCTYYRTIVARKARNHEQ